MALGIKTAMNDGDGSDFIPIVKYLSEAGRLYRIDRVGGSNGFESVPTELPVGTRMIFDFGSISVGWLHFAAGQAPSMHLVPVGHTLPAQPDKNHRQGFRMLLMTPDKVVREMATSAKTLLGAMDDLHGAYEAAPEAAQGKVPVVTFAGTAPLKRSYRDPASGVTGSKTTFAPAFTITSWVDRPAAFGPRTVPPPAAKGVTAAPQMTAAASGAAHTRAQGAAAGAAYAAAQPAAAIPPNDDDWEMPPPGSGPAEHVPAPAGDIDDDVPF